MACAPQWEFLNIIHAALKLCRKHCTCIWFSGERCPSSSQSGTHSSSSYRFHPLPDSRLHRIFAHLNLHVYSWQLGQRWLDWSGCSVDASHCPLNHRLAHRLWCRCLLPKQDDIFSAVSASLAPPRIMAMNSELHYHCPHWMKHLLPSCYCKWWAD